MVASVAPPAESTARIDRREEKSSTRAFTIVCVVVLIIFAILWFIPSLFALYTSLKENATASLPAGTILKDQTYTLHSYVTLFEQGDILNWYLSSAITSVLNVVLTVLTASLAAYPLARMRFRGRQFVYWLVLAGIMIPGQVLIVPWFREFNALGLLNTYWGVTLPQVPSAIAVFIFTQFFAALPSELEESARVDGASSWTIYRSIVMPLARPAVAAVSIFTFVFTWNNLLWPLLAVTNPKLMTIPVGLASVQGSFGQRNADILASAILGALPLILLFLFFQRRIVEGIAGTGLKG
jgi:multiple sugar transport system permease protein